MRVGCWYQVDTIFETLKWIVEGDKLLVRHRDHLFSDSSTIDSLIVEGGCVCMVVSENSNFVPGGCRSAMNKFA